MKYRYDIKPNWRRSMAGFTLVELMISTGVFSVVLLICTTAVLVIGQDFHKAAIASLTQNTSRNIIDNITRELQYNPSYVITPAPVYDNSSGVGHYAVCIGSVRYSYLLDYQLTDSAFDSTKKQSLYVLWRDATPLTGCVPVLLNGLAGSLSGGKELMSLHTRLRATNVFGAGFNVSLVGSNLYNIDVAVIYGDNDVIKDADKCVSIRGGGAFCGLSELHTAVFRKAK